MPWTVVLVFVLLAILGAHDRIAKAIGTAAPITQGTVTALSTVTSPPLSLTAVAPAEANAPLPNRPPRDPFQALVSPRGDRIPVAALSSTKHSHSGSQGSQGSSSSGQNGSSPGGTGTANCAAKHVVVAGESLWSIAQQHVNKTGHGSAAHYWHRIYSANHSAIGANPSQLAIGISLCLPAP